MMHINYPDTLIHLLNVISSLSSKLLRVFYLVVVDDAVENL